MLYYGPSEPVTENEYPLLDNGFNPVLKGTTVVDLHSSLQCALHACSVSAKFILN